MIYPTDERMEKLPMSVKMVSVVHTMLSSANFAANVLPFALHDRLHPRTMRKKKERTMKTIAKSTDIHHEDLKRTKIAVLRLQR